MPLAVAGLCAAMIAGCGCASRPARASFDPEKPYEVEDLMRFLMASPVLFPSLAGYERLAGDSGSIKRLEQLDVRAAEFGYVRYSEFAVAHTRISNALAYVKMVEKGGEAVGDAGGGGLLERDVRLILPYVDDVERVLRASLKPPSVSKEK